MFTEKQLEELVREVIRQMEAGDAGKVQPPRPAGGSLSPDRDYPLAQKHPELVRTSTGKGLDDITLNQVIAGEIKPEDVRITSQTLEMQAQIAEACGRKQFANNLRRAGELTKIPDQRILEIYNALRPYRSTKEELQNIAEELEQKYEARICAAFVREAADVYERRRRLKVV